MRFFYICLLYWVKYCLFKSERYMYCHKDSQNKRTFQVERKRKFNMTAHSMLNLCSYLFFLPLLTCGISGAR